MLIYGARKLVSTVDFQSRRMERYRFPTEAEGEASVAKMVSQAIFQYITLAIDDTHNTWTNMIVKMTILRLLGSNDDKEKIGVARPEGPPLRGFRLNRRRAK